MLENDEKIPDVHKEKKEMSLKEKIDYFDREIRLLHQFCINSGYSKKEIRQSAEPFLLATDSLAWQKTKRKLILVGVLIAVIAALYYCDPTYRFILAVSRITAIKLIPVWDWTKVHQWECMVDNPLYAGVTLTEEDCDICKDLETVERVTNLSGTDFHDNYLKPELPVIVEDGTKDWAKEKLQTNIETLYKAYKENNALHRNPVCGFHTDTKYNNLQLFLHQIVTSDTQSYTADWENCIKEGAKAFRSFYQRPYFLPQTVDISDSNWVFVSKGSVEHHYDVPLSNPFLMLIPLKGQFEIALSPREPCSKVCVDVTADLHGGEIMIVNMADLLWFKSYRPTGSGENILIGVGGSYE
ncbi:uncharacterized protein LOC134256883 [Saccostrea cucullata]|uniref:uncharacterized protein LOC134256883 n=1 Tax=Saccostrea cuccullata TaxID=36930 RepID=UPI002ED1F3CB